MTNHSAVAEEKSETRAFINEAKQRVEELITSAEQEGAKIVLDGRNCSVPGYEDGNFVGPPIITGVEPHMRCYTVATLF